MPWTGGPGANDCIAAPGFPSLRDRFGRLPGIAVCESDAHDSLAEAEWSFVAAGGSRQITDRLVADVETFVAESVDARVMARHLEYA